LSFRILCGGEYDLPLCGTAMLRHYLIHPSLFFVLAFFVVEISSFDLIFSDLLYELQGGSWKYKESWLLEDFLHSGGRTASGLVGLVLLLAIAASFSLSFLRERRRSLIYLFVSALTGALVVSMLKRYTHMDCPWDLSRYGGTLDYLRLFDSSSSSEGSGQCFPAGHASAAYCWFGLYFLAKVYCPKRQRLALVSVILLGMVFGLTQQIRGAHFISHDIWTAWICWISACFWSAVLLPVRREQG
jgi:membrane-associated PAP2 superfamily phosphatase